MRIAERVINEMSLSNEKQKKRREKKRLNSIEKPTFRYLQFIMVVLVNTADRAILL